jgi:hypothetical protein
MTMLALPYWPPSGNPFFANAREVFDAFRSSGLPIPGSLGLVAQAEAESAFKIDAAGDHVNGVATAFGVFQQHAARVAQIKQATGIDIMTFPPIAEQCRAAFWELEKFPALGLAQLRAATTAREAGIAGCKFFERAGQAGAAERRGAMGTRWSVYAAGNGWA